MEKSFIIYLLEFEKIELGKSKQAYFKVIRCTSLLPSWLAKRNSQAIL